MSDTNVQVMPNGPLRITGGAIKITDASGAAFDLAGRTTVSLCRCGQSKNRPFCDGNHNMAGFKSDDKARALPPPKV